jgi:hypothetical protein
LRASPLHVAALCAACIAAVSPVHAAPVKTGGNQPQTVQPGLTLAWNDCLGGAGAAQNLAYACSGENDVFTLYCALAVAQSVPGVIGAEVVVDIEHASASLPDWWQLGGSGTGGCRAGVLSASYDFSADPGCTDAWQTLGFGGIQGFTVGPPDHTFPNQARIKAVAAVTSDHAVTLLPGTEYGIVKLCISSQHTTGANACAGCAEAACLVFQSAILRVLPGVGSDLLIGEAAAPSADFATWQGTAADCSAVPARRTTWGTLKALYR